MKYAGLVVFCILGLVFIDATQEKEVVRQTEVVYLPQPAEVLAQVLVGTTTIAPIPTAPPAKEAEIVDHEN